MISLQGNPSEQISMGKPRSSPGQEGDQDWKIGRHHHQHDDPNNDNDDNGGDDDDFDEQVLTSCPGDPVAGIGHLAAFSVKV